MFIITSDKFFVFAIRWKCFSLLRLFRLTKWFLMPKHHSRLSSERKVCWFLPSRRRVMSFWLHYSLLEIKSEMFINRKYFAIFISFKNWIEFKFRIENVFYSEPSECLSGHSFPSFSEHWSLIEFWNFQFQKEPTTERKMKTYKRVISSH